MSLHLQLLLTGENALSGALFMQCGLQQQKDCVHAAARQWQERCEAGQARETLASVSRAELEGQLKAQSSEVDQLRLASQQQAKVSSWSYICITELF